MGRVQAATSGGPSTCTYTRRAAPLLGAHRGQTPARLTSSSPSLCTHPHRPHYPGEAPKAGAPPCLPPVTGDSPPHCRLFLPGRNCPPSAPVNPTPGSSPRPSHTVHQPLQPRARIPLLTALPPHPESPTLSLHAHHPPCPPATSSQPARGESPLLHPPGLAVVLKAPPFSPPPTPQAPQLHLPTQLLPPRQPDLITRQGSGLVLRAPQGRSPSPVAFCTISEMIGSLAVAVITNCHKPFDLSKRN